MKKNISDNIGQLFLFAVSWLTFLGLIFLSYYNPNPTNLTFLYLITIFGALCLVLIVYSAAIISLPNKEKPHLNHNAHNKEMSYTNNGMVAH